MSIIMRKWNWWSIFILATATQCEIYCHKEQSSVKVTARFMSSKLLMYPKVSITSFIYAVVDVFSCPISEVSKTYDTHEITKCFVYLLLTDMGSCSLQFLIVWASLVLSASRRLSKWFLFEDRLDISHAFSDKFNAQNPKAKRGGNRG